MSPAGGDQEANAYLKERGRFRHLAPDVFEALSSLREDIAVQRRAENLTSLEALGLLRHNTLYFHEPCPDSPAMRATWMARMAEVLDPALLLYLELEGALRREQSGRLEAGLDELSALRKPRRAILVYLGRIIGGRKQRELFDLIAGHVANVGFSGGDAIVLRPHTLRCFLLLDAGARLRARLAAFAERWREEAWLYPGVV